jgi:hypothetical protein
MHLNNLEDQDFPSTILPESSQILLGEDLTFCAMFDH